LGKISSQSKPCLTVISVIFSSFFLNLFQLQISKLIHFTENGYSEHQLLQKEQEILTILNFDLKVPLISQYLEYFMLHERNFGLSKVITVCHYLSNITLTEPKFLNRLASSVAAAILTLSRMLLCTFLTMDPKTIGFVYDEDLFEMKDFAEILNDLWIVFHDSLLNKDLYKVQFISKHSNLIILLFFFFINLKHLASETKVFK
jgi:hypothetical protein